MPRRSLQRHGRAPRADFSDFVKGLPASNLKLDVTHITSGYILRDILESGGMSPDEPCPVLKENLVYTFYGRSAFRPSNSDEPSDLSFLFPVAVILDPSALPPPSRMFAFDSGAFMAGFMDDFLDPRMPLFDFQVEPNLEYAARLVAAFFGSEENYGRNRPLSSVNIPQSNFEAQSYARMVSTMGRGSNKLDDRCTTIECLYKAPLSLKGAVRLVILPDALAEDDEIFSKIRSFGAEVKEYEWTGGSRPSEYHMEIRRLAANYKIKNQ
jgi:hypothetical protein